jgi:triosephosphate isomerase
MHQHTKAVTAASREPDPDLPAAEDADVAVDGDAFCWRAGATWDMKRLSGGPDPRRATGIRGGPGPMARIPVVVGNWKMNGSHREIATLVNGIVRGCAELEGVEAGVCPPFPYLADVRDQLDNSPIRLGAQNCHWETKGAYTGEVSPAMLRDVGCAYVILGHSERRHGLGETDAMINRKLRAAIAAGLTPILCIGELLAEREAGQTLAVVERQLRGSLDGLSPDDIGRLILAYEPVWAIGTGKNATPEQAQEIHLAVRRLVERLAGRPVAQALRIQYGGSVKPDNIDALMAQPDLDGALVGGASLDATGFCRIVHFKRR